MPDDDDPVILPRTSEGLYLLQRVRDEAHRFAIAHHRQRRAKAMTGSVLDDVPGLGPTRRRPCSRSSVRSRSCGPPASRRSQKSPASAPATAQSIVAALSGDTPAPAVDMATGEILEDAMTLLSQARAGHGHDRRRQGHGGQGAREARLLRHRQPAGRRCWSRRSRPSSGPRSTTSWPSWSTPAPVRSSTGWSTCSRSCAPAAPSTQVLFLEAADEVLVRRQEAARRPHPLSREGRLMDGFDRERELLSRLRGRADIVVDTTNLNVHQLGQRIQAAFEDADSKGLRASVVSFGFKYGIPIDADMVADMRFLPNPHWVDELRPLSGLDEPVRDYVRQQPRSEEFLDRYEEPGRAAHRRLPPRGQALPHHRHRLHGRTPPQCGDGRGLRRATARTRCAYPRRPPRPRPGMTAPGSREGRRARRRTRPGREPVSAAAAETDLTGVVTVADNGGSSGRLRDELGVLPPGDLRMALAALCADDEWGRRWAGILQHRFDGDGPLRDHAVGNLLIAAIWEILGDHVGGLDLVGQLLGARGRVLPMAAVPLDIEADVHLRSAPDRLTLIRGQVQVASVDGQVVSVRLDPTDPPACPEAVQAVLDADWVVIGPGSWFTSVMPTLLVPEPARRPGRHQRPSRPGAESPGAEGRDRGALSHGPPRGALGARARSRARRGASPTPRCPTNGAAWTTVCRELGARLVTADVANGPGSDQHDPQRLAEAFRGILHGGIE